MIKKSIKILSAGTGIVVVGLIALALFRTLEKTDDETQKDSVKDAGSERERSRADDEGEKSRAVSASTRAFIERRRKKAAKLRAAHIAARKRAKLSGAPV